MVDLEYELFYVPAAVIAEAEYSAPRLLYYWPEQRSLMNVNITITLSQSEYVWHMEQ